MTKKDYIKLLETVGLYMELKGENSFKVSAYRKAAGALEQSTTPIDAIDDFSVLPGIGKSVSELLSEYREKGSSTLLDELKQQVPEGHIRMLKIRNLGAKKIVKLHKELGITTIEELKAACERGEVSSLSGFGKKTEESILKGIEDLETKKGRLSINEAVRLTAFINQALETCEHINRFETAGSHRRMSEFSKDLDYIIETDHAALASDEIAALPMISDVEVKGNEKVSVHITLDDLETSVDFRFTDQSGFAQMLNHFTGSMEHNVKMRQLAKARDEKVNEYGITTADGLIQYESETEIYQHFGLHYIPPQMRDTVQAFEIDPREIITLDDIKGDLHMHTTASDGAHELEEMIEACIKKGYSYMVITDHSNSLKVANGLSAERLLEQHSKIKALNKSYSEIDIYSGTEMDILPDGTLDYEDDVLKELDYVIAAIHQSFNQTEEQIMTRLINACRNPYVRQIAHPTGRLLGERDGYAVNMEQLIAKAKETNTVLEINAHPVRLDLSSEVIKDQNLTLAINTDAHHINHLELMKYGVGTAIKAFVKPEQVINTMDRKAFSAWLKKGKN